MSVPHTRWEWRALDPRAVFDLVEYERPLTESERRYVAKSRAASTLRGYRTDWLQWCDWCREHDAAALPARPDMLSQWIAKLADAGATRGTIARKLSALRYVHAGLGLDDPTEHPRVVMVWEGIRRDIAQEGTARSVTTQAPPLMPPLLWDVVDACPTMTTWTTRDNEASLAGARDRCLLLVGFFGALRRSELIRVDLEHIHRDARGYVIELPWSKTNQRGAKTDLVALPRTSKADYCPVRAIDTWRELAGLTSGPLLRSVTKGNRAGRSLSGDGVNRLVVGAIRRAGLPTAVAPSTLGSDPLGERSDVDTDDATAKDSPAPRLVSYSAHSLRAGFVTYAHSRGATPSQIAHQTRHASLASVQTYTRISNVWEDNAVTHFGL